jgi:acetyltransferase-like isoleucine patch superfamily enzyme
VKNFPKKIKKDFTFDKRMDDFELSLEQKGFLQKIRNKIFALIGQYLLSNELRLRFYKCMGVKIGNNVFIGKYTLIDDTFPDLISIEDNANISFGVTIVAHDASKRKTDRVLIQKGAYIGTRAIILPGIVIGENAVVGAGSVVTKDVEAYTKVAGVPAQIIEKS